MPVPEYDKQVWSDRLQVRVGEMLERQWVAETELNAMLPSIVDKTFKWEL